MPITTSEKARLIRISNILAGKEKRTSRASHLCGFCTATINPGDIYRDGGLGRKAHEHCYLTVAERIRS